MVWHSAPQLWAEKQYNLYVAACVRDHMSEYIVFRFTLYNQSSSQHSSACGSVMCVDNAHPTAAYARGQLTSFLRGHKKGFGVKPDSTVKTGVKVIGVTRGHQTRGKT